MADLIIANGYVVTMNGAREIIADGAVAIEGKRIAAVGPSAEVLARHGSAHVIDAHDMMVIPGLIDAHMHPNQYLSNGIGDDGDLMTWLFGRIYPYEAALTPEEGYLGGLGAYVEAIRSGTTCFNDPGGRNADDLARAAVDVGIRGITSRSTQDLGSEETPIPARLIDDTDTCLGRAGAHVKRWHGAAEGCLRAWYSLRYPLNVTDALCRGAKALADRDGVGLHAHAAEAKGDAFRWNSLWPRIAQFFDMPRGRGATGAAGDPHARLPGGLGGRGRTPRAAAPRLRGIGKLGVRRPHLLAEVRQALFQPRCPRAQCLHECALQR